MKLSLLELLSLGLSISLIDSLGLYFLRFYSGGARRRLLCQHFPDTAETLFGLSLDGDDIFGVCADFGYEGCSTSALTFFL